MVVDELSGRITSYIDDGKNRTLHRLSKDSGVPYITVRRIVQKEVKTVALENAIALLTAMGESDSAAVVSLVEKWFPEGGKVIREFHEKLSSAKVVDKAISDQMPNYNFWATLSLAERSCGVSPDQLSKLLGVREAKEALEELEAIDAIEFRGGNVHLKQKSFTTSGNPKFVLSELVHMSRAYDVKRRSEPGHLLSTVVTGLNKDGLDKLREVLKDAAIQVAAIAQEKSYAGEELAFCGIIGGTFAIEKGEKL